MYWFIRTNLNWATSPVTSDTNPLTTSRGRWQGLSTADGNWITCTSYGFAPGNCRRVHGGFFGAMGRKLQIIDVLILSRSGNAWSPCSHGWNVSWFKCVLCIWILKIKKVTVKGNGKLWLEWIHKGVAIPVAFLASTFRDLGSGFKQFVCSTLYLGEMVPMC